MRSRIGVHRCRQAGAAAEAERGQATWRPRKLRWFSIRRHLAPVGGCCSCISHLATTQLLPVCGCPSAPHTASWRYDRHSMRARQHDFGSNVADV